MSKIIGSLDSPFYSPQTTDTSTGSPTVTLDFQAPAPVFASRAAAPTDVLYLTEKGESSAINVADINQGQLGDCFLLSSIGEIVLNQPSFISSMITANSNGTETVRLFESASGSLPNFSTTSFKSVSETVTNVFSGSSVNNGANQDVLSGQKEIWPQVLEKAVAQLDGGYSAIANGGYPAVAMEELTGKSASSVSTGNLTLAQLLGFSQAGDLMVFDTSSKSGLIDNLVSSHAYMFDGVSGSGSAATVKLLNPWGTDQPAPVLFSQLSKAITDVEIGHLPI